MLLSMTAWSCGQICNNLDWEVRGLKSERRCHHFSFRWDDWKSTTKARGMEKCSMNEKCRGVFFCSDFREEIFVDLNRKRFLTVARFELSTFRSYIFIFKFKLINYLFSLTNSSLCRDLNLGPPKYQADALPIELSRLGYHAHFLLFSLHLLRVTQYL